MNKNKLVIAFFVLVIVLGFGVYYFSSKDKTIPPGEDINSPLVSSVVYKNNDYGFNFSLPANWQGYSIVSNTWEGMSLTTSTIVETGPKLLIRDPKWTVTSPHEDLPILVFTIQQWNSYLAENFSIGAAPIKASELARNNTYVFALPTRWDFDYSLGFKEAQDIIAGNPIRTFDLVIVDKPQGKLNINVICEQAISYMKFTDAKSADLFIADCKEGKHPEVIEKYKADMNLGDGVAI